MKLRNLFLLVLLPAAPGILFGQQDAPAVPSRVARLNYVYGQVSLRPAAADDWAAATSNQPLTTGDHLWTDADANAEIHVGAAAVRLASQAAMGIVNLDDHTTQISLSQGSMNVRVPRLEPGEVFEVDTPNGAVTLNTAGDYRIDASTDSEYTAVTVRSGEALVTGNGKSFAVPTGKQSRFAGTDEITAETTDNAPGPDQWDRWCSSRDQREDYMTRLSEPYIPATAGMTGMADLAEYGTWRQDPTLGAVWAPTNPAAGWEPYGFGRWTNVEPWGWTWVDDAPWGFAPFHYGRWALLNGEWVWVPGPYGPGVRAVFAPALVAFLGGDGFGPGLSAWVALGPHERYEPWCHCGPAYAMRVNIGATVVVRGGGFVNANHVVAVRSEVLRGGGPIHRDAVKLSAGAMVGAHAVPAASLGAFRRQAAAPGTVRTPPAAVASRSVIVKSAPPAPQHGAVLFRTADPTRPSSTSARTAPAPQGAPRATGPASASQNAGAGRASGASSGPRPSGGTPTNRAPSGGSLAAANPQNPALAASRAASAKAGSGQVGNRHPAGTTAAAGGTGRKTSAVNAPAPRNAGTPRHNTGSNGSTPGTSRAAYSASVPSRSSGGAPARTSTPSTPTRSATPAPAPRVATPAPAPRTTVTIHH